MRSWGRNTLRFILLSLEVLLHVVSVPITLFVFMSESSPFNLFAGTTSYAQLAIIPKTPTIH